MIFQKLKTSKCPTCGCQTVVSEFVEVDAYGQKPRIREHAHGGRWEHRKFLCGFEAVWCPNFDRAEIKAVCPSDPELIRLTKAHDALSVKEDKIRDARRKASDAIHHYAKSQSL